MTQATRATMRACLRNALTSLLLAMPSANGWSPPGWIKASEQNRIAESVNKAAGSVSSVFLPETLNSEPFLLAVFSQFLFPLFIFRGGSRAHRTRKTKDWNWKPKPFLQYLVLGLSTHYFPCMHQSLHFWNEDDHTASLEISVKYKKE